MLIYPVTNYGFDTASCLENADGYLLTREAMRWFWGHYLNDEAEGADPRASPLRAADLSRLLLDERRTQPHPGARRRDRRGR